MPRGDRTGPNGFGPMTGRGAGYCNGFDRTGNLSNNRRFGRGFFNFFRNGFGRSEVGFGNRDFYSQSTASPESEKAYLEEEVKNLKFHLTDLEARLSELNKG